MVLGGVAQAESVIKPAVTVAITAKLRIAPILFSSTGRVRQLKEGPVNDCMVWSAKLEQTAHDT